MAVEFYKSAVAVMVKADDPTQVRVMPVALLPEYEEWHVHSDVTEIGKDGIPVDGTMRVVTQGSRTIRGNVSVVYDAPTGKVEGELLTAVPTTCVVRVETPEGVAIEAPVTAEKLDGKAMDALVAEKPVFEAKFTDQPTAKAAPIEEPLEEAVP